MDKYFMMQGKRLLRFLPGALLAAFVLLGGLLIAYQSIISQNATSMEQQKVQIALVGDTDDPYLQVGLTAFSGFDSTQFTLELQQMDLETAKDKLNKGKLAAYVEVPENFMEEAMNGNILPLRFVSKTGATSLVSIFKDELTEVITDMLSASQKGVYGMEAAASDNSLSVGKRMDKMSLQYGEYVFVRDKVYALEELGIADALGLEGYMLCGMSVLFLLLCCLPFAPLLIRKDLALQQMLRAKGASAWKQTLAELGAYMLCLLAMILVVLGIATVVGKGSFPILAILPRIIPVILLAASMSYMLCCLSTDLTGGIVLQFFFVLALCFVSGCLYPVYMVPASVQQAAAYLPAGLARSLLSGCITEESAGLLPLWILGYTAVFFVVAALVNDRRIKGVAK